MKPRHHQRFYNGGVALVVAGLVIAGMICAWEAVVTYALAFGGAYVWLGLEKMSYHAWFTTPGRALALVEFSTVGWEPSAFKIERAVRNETPPPAALCQVALWVSIVSAVFFAHVWVTNGNLRHGPEFRTFAMFSYWALTVCYGVIVFMWAKENLPGRLDGVSRKISATVKCGVAGLEHAQRLKNLNDEITALFVSNLQAAPPPDRYENFFAALARSGGRDCQRRMAAAVSEAEDYVARLRVAVRERAEVAGHFREAADDVNRSALGTLLVSMDEIYTALNSDALTDLLRRSQWDEYHEILRSLNADIARNRELSRQPRADSEPDDGGQPRRDAPLTLDEAREILGAGPDDLFDDIKKSYLRLVKQLHSDHGAGRADDENKRREARLKRLNAAMDEVKKAREQGALT